MGSDKFSISEYYENAFEQSSEKVLIEVRSEEQEESYSCGPAVITDVLKTLDIPVDQKQIMNEVRAEIRKLRPVKSKKSLSDYGTPPKAIETILGNYGVELDVRPSDPEITDETTPEQIAQMEEAAEKFLDAKLREGYVIITPVQTIPEIRPLAENESFKDLRNIEEDGHYLIVCGVVTIDGKKSYITVDPMFHYYQRASNEGWVYGMHKGENIDEHTPKTAPEVEYESVETRKIPYTAEQLKNFGIDPSKYGLRLVSAANFMRNWKDVSGFGEPFNHFGIAVKINE